MKKIIGLAAGALVAAIAVPSLAQAQTAYTTTYVNLRTGPGFGYPIVLAVPAQAPLDTYGCLNDWSWCDVSFNGYRGWMAGDYIAYVRDDRWIPVYDYGPRYSVPIITFSFGTYWDTYYRGRPWYRDRDRWAHYDRDHHDDHRPPPHRDMPRTLPRGPVHANPPHPNPPHPNPPGHGDNDHRNDRRDNDQNQDHH